jgi:3-deoxy-manno-octulosonate cytidylyltransferase (CMP-KDO synthetase)
MKIIGLIPCRLKSTRLKNKPLLKLGTLPMIIHTYRRAKLCKQLDDVIVCCDNIKIKKICEKYNAKSMMTSSKHTNGTERIAEAYLKLKKKYDFIIDIQGDEPLINPLDINKVISFHKKNKNIDIILPTLLSRIKSSKNIVKVMKDKNNNVIYLSRYNLPFEFRAKNKSYYKHLSIISFKPSSLLKFYKHKQTPAEKAESIELLRALEIGLKIKTLSLKGNSFSVDIKEHYTKAKKYIAKDKLFLIYKEKL